MSNVLNINLLNSENMEIPKEFVLDTNVLLWTFYSKSSFQNRNASAYSNFIANLIAQNKHLIILFNNFCEMIYVVEKIEYALYCAENNINKKTYPLKRFRRNCTQRHQVKEEIELLYEQITNIEQIQIIKESCSLNTVYTYIDKFGEHVLDFFDYSALEYCNENNIPLISDDGDFGNELHKFDVYTANTNLLSSH